MESDLADVTVPAFRAQLVNLPQAPYYTIVEAEGLRPLPEADSWLRALRLAQNRAESTTKSYASAVALLLTWCALTGRDWRVAPYSLGSFQMWLRTYDVRADGSRRKRKVTQARQEGRINLVLIAVRSFYLHCVSQQILPESVVSALYELIAVGGHQHADAPSNAPRARALHRVQVPRSQVDRATDNEAVALLRACRSARDRALIIFQARLGCRRGELVGLRHDDVHFGTGQYSRCRSVGPHVHVIRRENSNRAHAKSRVPREIPADDLVLQAYDHWIAERDDVSGAAECAFLFVVRKGFSTGQPMRPDAVNELFADLCRRAKLDREVTPHMLRHAFANNMLDAGAQIDEVQALLGHANPQTTISTYSHANPQRLRDSISRVPVIRPEATP